MVTTLPDFRVSSTICLLRRSATVPVTVRMTRVVSAIATVTGPDAVWTWSLSVVMSMTIPLTGPLPPGGAATLGVVATASAAIDATSTDKIRGDRLCERCKMRPYGRSLTLSILEKEP